MANAIYPKAKEALLGGDLAVDSDTIKAYILDDDYTYNAAHDFLNDIPAGARLATVTLASKTITNGIFDSADPTWTSVTGGGTVTRIVVYQDTGNEATSRLFLFLDTKGDGTPISIPTVGGNITYVVPVAGWLS
jgi:hypothetical protein